MNRNTSRQNLDSNADSSDLFRIARQYIPGGVSRNTLYREPHPDYADFGKGCFVTDVQGVQRIDMANNMASLIHGHAHPEIVAAVSEQLKRGSAFTMATEPEIQLAKLLCDRVPWFEKIRFMNSGTEAVMAAIKAARAFTGRAKVAKAEGTYHGTYDYAEVSQNSPPDQWGSAEQPNSVPVASGTPQNALNDVVVFPFNDLERTVDLLNANADELACILIDVIPQRAGLSAAAPEYINSIRDWATRHNVVLIFDEVISFRMALSGAAEWYDVKPDLTTLGKIIGGGFPVGALAGEERIMSVMDPLESTLPFPWSGTFAANPITMTAGRMAMQLYDQAAIDRLNQLGELARTEIAGLIKNRGIQASVTGAGSMFRIHPKSKAPTDYRSTWQDDREKQKTKRLVDYMYDQGFMLFRTCTAALSTATTESAIEQFVKTLEQGFKAW